MPRALFLADAAGIDATGFTADTHPWGRQGEKSEVREVLSRVKAIADVTLDTPAMGGPRIPLSDDGRASWGGDPAARDAVGGLAGPVAGLQGSPAVPA
jgi:vancomycin permeability regulator SanA